jgi:hypothetical protein
MYPHKPKQSADDEKCLSCRGTSVIVVLNPAAPPEIRQPPVCPSCGGVGARLWDGAKRYFLMMPPLLPYVTADLAYGGASSNTTLAERC